VVVTVGTDHHPFDRLIGWADRWAAAHPEVDVLIQHGTAAAPAHARAVAMAPYDELVAAMAEADAVVAQGGPATIMDARSVGHRPIVVPRLARRGEVVDDHQVPFAGWMAERGWALLASDEDELGRLLDRALADPATVRIRPERAASAETLAAFAAVVDPLLARRAGNGARWGRIRPGRRSPAGPA
jgi:UDP-N-acetylglucosamine transferase subunit ALG13